MFISPKYKKFNETMHASPRGFGGSGFRWAEVVCGIVHRLKIKSMLDYGCGQSTLWKKMAMPELDYYEYDPCILGKDQPPMPADLVTCTDVLEHIEPEYLDKVINHLHELGRVAIYLNINIGASNKSLPNGKNAHLIIKPPEWWRGRLKKVFREGEWKWEELPSERPNKDFFILLIRRGNS